VGVSVGGVSVDVGLGVKVGLGDVEALGVGLDVPDGLGVGVGELVSVGSGVWLPSVALGVGEVSPVAVGDKVVVGVLVNG
jgi:hypothetical protein